MTQEPAWLYRVLRPNQGIVKLARTGSLVKVQLTSRTVFPKGVKAHFLHPLACETKLGFYDRRSKMFFDCQVSCATQSAPIKPLTRTVYPCKKRVSSF